MRSPVVGAVLLAIVSALLLFVELVGPLPAIVFAPLVAVSAVGVLRVWVTL